MSDTNMSGFNLFGETTKQKMEKEERKKIKERKELNENLKNKPYDSITNDDLGGGRRTRRTRRRKLRTKKSKKSRKSRKHRK
jgi:hypothetical protein